MPGSRHRGPSPRAGSPRCASHLTVGRHHLLDAFRPVAIIAQLVAGNDAKARRLPAREQLQDHRRLHRCRVLHTGHQVERERACRRATPGHACRALQSNAATCPCVLALPSLNSNSSGRTPSALTCIVLRSRAAELMRHAPEQARERPCFVEPGCRCLPRLRGSIRSPTVQAPITHLVARRVRLERCVPPRPSPCVPTGSAWRAAHAAPSSQRRRERCDHAAGLPRIRIERATGASRRWPSSQCAPSREMRACRAHTSGSLADKCDVPALQHARGERVIRHRPAAPGLWPVGPRGRRRVRASRNARWRRARRRLPASTRRCVCRPRYFGSSEGWILSIRPGMAVHETRAQDAHEAGEYAPVPARSSSTHRRARASNSDAIACRLERARSEVRARAAHCERAARPGGR